MRGSLTLDFLFSVILLMVTFTSLSALAYTQMENTMVAAAQFKAQGMAMSIGSAINHFIAVRPETGSELDLGFQGIDGWNGAGTSGLPEAFSIFAPSDECTVYLDPVDDRVKVEIVAHRLDSSTGTNVTATYPIVSMNYKILGVVRTSCSGGVKLSAQNGAVDVTYLE